MNDIGTIYGAIRMQVDRLRADVNAAQGHIKKLEESAKRDSDSVSSSFNKINNSAQSIMPTLQKLAGIFTAYKLATMAKDAIMTSARYETLGVVMHKVGETAGYSRDEMNKYEQGLRKAGIAAVETRTTLARLVQANIDLSQSSKLARLAQDAAVIAGINSSEAFERMVHGIQAQNAIILRTMGIMVDFDAAHEKYAKTLDTTKDKLTRLQKTQANVNAVFETGAAITGVYEAAMNTAGKQIFSLPRYLQDLQLAFGEAFNPALADVVKEITKRIKEWTQAMKDAQGEISGLGTTGKESLNTALNIIEGIAGAMNTLLRGFNQMPGWMQELGIIGGFLFGKTGLAVVAGASLAIEMISNEIRAAGLYSAGKLDLEDWAGAKNQAELRKVIQEAISGQKDWQAELAKSQAALSMVDDRIKDVEKSSSRSSAKLLEYLDVEREKLLEKIRVINLAIEAQEEAAALTDRWQAQLNALGGWGSTHGVRVPIPDVDKTADDLTKLQDKYAKFVTETQRAIKLAGMTEAQAEIAKFTWLIEDAQKEYAKLGKNTQITELLTALAAAEKRAKDAKALADALTASDEAAQKLADDVTQAMTDLDVKIRSVTQSYEDWKDQMRFETMIAGMDDLSAKTAKQERQIQALIKQYALAGNMTPEEIRRIVTAHNAAIEAVDAHKKAVDEWQKQYDRVAQSLQEHLADIFENIGGNWNDLLKGMLNAFKRMIAEMLAAQAINRVFQPMYNAVFPSPTGGITSNPSGVNVGLPGTISNGLSTGSSILSGASALASSSFLWGTAPMAGAAEMGLMGGGAAGLFGTWGATGALASFSAIAGPLAIALGAIAVALPLLMNDRPQPEFGTGGEIPGSLQGFLSAKPSDLLNVTKMNADARESAGTDAAAVQEIYDSVTGGFQDLFKAVYDSMPQAVQDAWDAIDVEGFAQDIRLSRRKTTALAIAGHLKYWVQGLNDTLTTEFINATAQAFSPENGEQLGAAWTESLNSWFQPLIDSAESVEEIQGVITQYSETLAQFFEGLSTIMKYRDLTREDIMKDLDIYMEDDPLKKLAASIELVDVQIKFITDSIGDLDFAGQAAAIQQIGALTVQRYQLELEYIATLKTMQKDLTDSLNAQVEGFAWDIKTPEQQYAYATEQRTAAFNAAYNATDESSLAAAIQDYIKWSNEQWTLGGKLFGTEWQTANLGAFQTDAGNLNSLVEGTFGQSIQEIIDGHGDLADSTVAAVSGTDALSDSAGKASTSLDDLADNVDDLNLVLPTLTTSIVNIADMSTTVISLVKGEASELNG